MALHLIAEAILRLEHKVDILLNRMLSAGAHPQMNFTGVPCPVCKMPIDYVVDIEHQVAVRKCNCYSGKVTSSFPIFTKIPPAGAPNARSSGRQSSSDSDSEPGTEDGSGRKGR